MSTTDYAQIVDGMLHLRVALEVLDLKLRAASGQVGDGPQERKRLAAALGRLKGEDYPTAVALAVQTFVQHSEGVERPKFFMAAFVGYARLVIAGELTAARAIEKANWLRKEHGEPPTPHTATEIDRAITISKSERTRTLRVYTLLAAGSSAPQGERFRVDEGHIEGRRGPRKELAAAIDGAPKTKDGPTPAVHRVRKPVPPYLAQMSDKPERAIVTGGSVPLGTWPTPNTDRPRASIRPKKSAKK